MAKSTASTASAALTTYEAIARALGRPPATVRYWARHGAPITVGRANDLAAIRQWLASWEQTNPPKSSEPKSAAARQLAEAKLALEVRQRKFQNELLEIKLAQQRRELIAVADAMRQIGDLARAIRQRMLALPPAVAERLVGGDRRSIERMLRKAIEDALEEASATLSESCSPPPPPN